MQDNHRLRNWRGDTGTRRRCVTVCPGRRASECKTITASGTGEVGWYWDTQEVCHCLPGGEGLNARQSPPQELEWWHWDTQEVCHCLPGGEGLIECKKS